MEKNVEELKKQAEESKKISDAYLDAIRRRVDSAQESGDIPEDFVYSYAGHTWLMVLPHSVMAQKRLLAARDKYLTTEDFADEEAFLRLIVPNVKVDGVPVNLDQLDLGALEIMKTAYMDSLLLPLSRGGDTAVTNYMKLAAANVG